MQEFRDHVLAGAALSSQKDGRNLAGSNAASEMHQPLHRCRFGDHVKTARLAPAGCGQLRSGIAVFFDAAENNRGSSDLPAVVANRGDTAADRTRLTPARNQQTTLIEFLQCVISDRALDKTAGSAMTFQLHHLVDVSMAGLR